MEIFTKFKFPWTNKPFVRCENIFVGWDDCREALELFCDGIDGWSLNLDEKGVDVGLNFPTVEIDGEQIPMVNILPLEQQAKVIAICESVHSDYLPLKKFIEEFDGELSKDKIIAYMNAHHNNIARFDGRTIVKELRYRLGVGGWMVLESAQVEK